MNYLRSWMFFTSLIILEGLFTKISHRVVSTSSRYAVGHTWSRRQSRVCGHQQHMGIKWSWTLSLLAFFMLWTKQIFPVAVSRATATGTATQSTTWPKKAKNWKEKNKKKKKNTNRNTKKNAKKPPQCRWLIYHSLLQGGLVKLLPS